MKLQETANMDEILNFLSDKIIDPNYTEQIGKKFNDILLLIVTKCFKFDADDLLLHPTKCVALAKLLRFSPDVQRLV